MHAQGITALVYRVGVAYVGGAGETALLNKSGLVWEDLVLKIETRSQELVGFSSQFSH